MDNDKATQFVNSLAKSIQALCNGYIDFDSTVEVVGHIHLSIDSSKKFDYVLTEEMNKCPAEDAVLFKSRSYHSRLPPGFEPETHNSDTPSLQKSSHRNSAPVEDSNSASDIGSSDSTLVVTQTSAPKSAPSKPASEKVQMQVRVRKADSQESLASAPKRVRSDDSTSVSEHASEFEVVEVKQEPEDDSYNTSVVNVENPSTRDVYVPRIESVTGAGTLVPMSSGAGPIQQEQPFPLMLHANSSLASQFVPVSTLSSSTIGPVPSTSGGLNMEDRKRFRYTIEDDCAILYQVIRLNPWAHGMTWRAVAAAVKAADVSVKRFPTALKAKSILDRTNTLMDNRKKRVQIMMGSGMVSEPLSNLDRAVDEAIRMKAEAEQEEKYKKLKGQKSDAERDKEPSSSSSSPKGMAQCVGVWMPSHQGSGLMKINVMNDGKQVKLVKQGSPISLSSGGQVVKTFIMKDGQLVPLGQESVSPAAKTPPQAPQIKVEPEEAGATGAAMTKRLPKKKDKQDMMLGGFSTATKTSKTNKRRKSKRTNKSKKSASGGTGFHSTRKSTMKAKESLRKKAQYGYVEYSDEDMEKAIELIHNGMPVQDAAFKFCIPRATLFNRSRDGCPSHAGRCSEAFFRAHGSVPTTYGKKRRHGQYSPEAVEEAIEAVHQGMPVIDASILYKIPRASLFIRSAKGCPSHPGRCSTVYSDGKIHRTKTSRFKYQELMERSQSETPESSKGKPKSPRKKPSSKKPMTSGSQTPATSGPKKPATSGPPKPIPFGTPETTMLPMINPKTGKVVHIPMKIVSLKPPGSDNPAAGSSQATEGEDLDHQFETLTTSNSKVVLERLKRPVINIKTRHSDDDDY